MELIKEALIRRYPNRKLYLVNREDVLAKAGLASEVDKGYINYNVVEKLVKNGFQVTIMDNVKQVDITKPLLSRLILNKQEKMLNALSLADLHEQITALERVTALPQECPSNAQN
jgi:polyhydroxyalkanoate synthesis regulator protein